MNKSPLRYPGGKTRACKTLANIFKLHFLDKSPHNSCGEQSSPLGTGIPFDCIYSPFFGGGSFEFYLQSVMQNNWEYKKAQKDSAIPKGKDFRPVLAAPSIGTIREIPSPKEFKIFANDKFTPLYHF